MRLDNWLQVEMLESPTGNTWGLLCVYAILSLEKKNGRGKGRSLRAVMAGAPAKTSYWINENAFTNLSF